MIPIPGLSSLTTVLLGTAAMLALGFVGGCEVQGWKDKAAELATTQATAKLISQKQAEAQELGEALAGVTITAGQQFAAAQQTLQTRTVTLIQKVPFYVESPTKPSSVCTVPLGLVRVLNSAARGGSDPESDFPLPAGRANNTVTAIDLASLASAIVRNYRIANGNAQQLDALNQWIRDQQALIGKVK